jgi:hypothetical protein
MVRSRDARSRSATANGDVQLCTHVARRQNGALDQRNQPAPGYAISLSKRWLVEKPFGWLKQIGPLKKVKLRGLGKVDWLFVFSCAAFNLIRIPKLRAQSA